MRFLILSSTRDLRVLPDRALTGAFASLVGCLEGFWPVDGRRVLRDCMVDAYRPAQAVTALRLVDVVDSFPVILQLQDYLYLLSTIDNRPGK